MTSRLTLLTLVLFLFNCHYVHAQDLDTVSLSGRVMDQNGALIPGAEVEVTLSKMRLTRKTMTDAQGRYRLIQLEPGNYQIRVTPAGDASTVVYDSGTLSLPAAADLLIAAVPNTGPGASPGSSQTSTPPTRQVHSSTISTRRTARAR